MKKKLILTIVFFVSNFNIDAMQMSDVELKDFFRDNGSQYEPLNVRALQHMGDEFDRIEEVITNKQVYAANHVGRGRYIALAVGGVLVIGAWITGASDKLLVQTDKSPATWVALAAGAYGVYAPWREKRKQEASLGTLKELRERGRQMREAAQTQDCNCEGVGEVGNSTDDRDVAGASELELEARAWWAIYEMLRSARSSENNNFESEGDVLVESAASLSASDDEQGAGKEESFIA